MSNRFLNNASISDYARETTLEQVEDTLTNGILNVTVLSTSGTADINLIEIAGNSISVNSGVNSTGTQRVTIATDDQVNTTLTSINTDTTGILADTAQIQPDIANIAIDINNIDNNITSVITSNAFDVNIVTDENNFIDLIDGSITGRESGQLICSSKNILDGINNVINSNSGDYNLKLIETAGGEACSIVTSDNFLSSNWMIEVRYFITNSTNTITTENIMVTGNTAVSLANNCYRIISMKKLDSAASSGSGDTFIFRTADGSTLGIPDDDPIFVMNNEIRTGQVGQIYIPPNRTLYINSINISTNSVDNINVILRDFFELSDLNESRIILDMSIKYNIHLEDLHFSFPGPRTLHFDTQASVPVFSNKISIVVDYTLVT